MNSHCSYTKYLNDIIFLPALLFNQLFTWHPSCKNDCMPHKYFPMLFVVCCPRNSKILLNSQPGYRPFFFFSPRHKSPLISKYLVCCYHGCFLMLTETFHHITCNDISRQFFFLLCMCKKSQHPCLSLLRQEGPHSGPFAQTQIDVVRICPSFFCVKMTIHT